MEKRPLKIAITTPEVPVSDRPICGAGVRMIGIGEGLKEHGCEVVYVVDDRLAGRFGAKPDRPDVVYKSFAANVGHTSSVHSFYSSFQPDVVIHQFFGHFRGCHYKKGVNVLDIHGPQTLEGQYHTGDDDYAKKHESLIGYALHNSNIITYPGEMQLGYQVGLMVNHSIGVWRGAKDLIYVPLSQPKTMPEKKYSDDPQVVYAGMALAWQEPINGIKILLEEMENLQKGKLHFFGGLHTFAEGVKEPQSYIDLRKAISASKRAVIHGKVPRQTLLDFYANKADFAWDLFPVNFERRLAATTRTPEYWWAGLATVYGDYKSEFSYDILQNGNGWLVNGNDEDAIRNLARFLLQNPEEYKARGKLAQDLIAKKYNNFDATKPLFDKLCELVYNK